MSREQRQIDQSVFIHEDSDVELEMSRSSKGHMGLLVQQLG